MADQVINSRKVNFDLTMQRGTEQKSRSLTFNSYNTTQDKAELREPAQAIAESLIGGYNKLIQPNQWRDDDNAEEEWTTISVKPTIIDTQEIEMEEVAVPDTTQKKTLD